SKDTYEGQINNPLTLNLFTYVHNSPLIYTDPSGHWAFVIPAIEAAMPYVIGAVTVLTGIKVGVDINNKGVNGFDTYQSKPTIIQQPRVKAKTQVITTPPITKKKVTVSQQPKVKQGPIVSQQPIIKQKPVVVQVRGPHNWGNRATLPRHVRDHGSDFNITSQDEYAYRANEFFLNRGRYRVKTDENGIIKVYEPQTNTFGAYNPDGTTKTFFKPTSPTYWQRQRGR
ncbi:hypothetical protein ABE099_02085, partial [Paenibacillus turicensis]|uniref:hypothetical protein n=1 Tax=Paenibacillus turicensis TaxID=160487 RepID=UPI003D27033C